MALLEVEVYYWPSMDPSRSKKSSKAYGVAGKTSRCFLVLSIIILPLLVSGCGASEAGRNPQSELDEPALTDTADASTVTGGSNNKVRTAGEDNCDNGGQRAIYLRTDFNGYRPGDQADITLVNNSQNFVSYDYCSLDLVLQHCEADGWKSYELDWSPPNYGGREDCTLGWQGTGPGGGGGLTGVSLPDDLPVGTYRFAHKIGVGGLPWEDPDPDPQIVWSEPFQVRDRESPANDICPSGQERQIYLTTDAPSYRPGDHPRFTLVNHTEKQLIAGKCVGGSAFETGSNLQRLEADGWYTYKTSLSSFHSGPYACADVGLLLEPGGGLADEIYIQPDLPAGTYRLTYAVGIGGPASPPDFEHRNVACSDPFEVTEPDPAR